MIKPRPHVATLQAALLMVVVTSSSVVVAQQRNLNTIDLEAYSEFPDAMAAMSASHLPVDGSGLIGRNRQWGALYSPRFQYGAGHALRMTIAADRPDESARAFRAIEAGATHIQSDGYVHSTLPAHMSGKPSRADITSGAAFFLSDACMGMRALMAWERKDAVANDRRLTTVRNALGRANGWLLEQLALLNKIDQHAPNRLLMNARAFQACGVLSSDAGVQNASRQAAHKLIVQAVALYSEQGHFMEGGGHDTSYQAVALRIGEDILLAGYPDVDGHLSSALTGAANWLSDRVDSQGRINSSGNTRTCWSEEQVFNKPKLISVTDVFTSLVYAGIRTNDQQHVRSARNVARWARTNPGANPCYQ